MTTNEVCIVCGQTKEWHTANKPIHAFSAQASLDASRQSATPRTSQDTPDFKLALARVKRQCDPVLRLLLMKHQVVSQEELDLMEYKVAHALSEGRSVIDVAAEGNSQGLHSDGGDSSSHSGDRNGGATVRGLRTRDTEVVRSSYLLDPQDDEQSGQSVQQLPPGSGHDTAAD